jgi:hypothetical protein
LISGDGVVKLGESDDFFEGCKTDCLISRLCDRGTDV